jgi:Egh16-like virulence factor
MRYSILFVSAALVSQISAHGLVTRVQGANGVTMPALGCKSSISSFLPLLSRIHQLMIITVTDGTPRDCASPGCGSEADTSIIRSNELGTGKASALGRNKAGPIDAAAGVASFMGSAAGAAPATAAAPAAAAKRQLGALLGGGKGAAAGGATSTGTKTAAGVKEDAVASMAGAGAASGLPTTDDQGAITMTFHQVNQDGAGPLTGMVDATSGGTDPAAFKSAMVTMNVPGIGIGGLSAAQTTDFPIKVQMPAGMTCSATVAGTPNVCVAKVQNSAAAGPFGGSAAFTQSPAAAKRAVEYNLRKRHMARGILGKAE